MQSNEKCRCRVTWSWIPAQPLPRGPWANHSISLSLSFLNYITKIILLKVQELMFRKLLVPGLFYGLVRNKYKKSSKILEHSRYKISYVWKKRIIYYLPIIILYTTPQNYFYFIKHYKYIILFDPFNSVKKSLHISILQSNKLRCKCLASGWSSQGHTVLQQRS